MNQYALCNTWKQPVLGHNNTNLIRSCSSFLIHQFNNERDGMLMTSVNHTDLRNDDRAGDVGWIQQDPM